MLNIEELRKLLEDAFKKSVEEEKIHEVEKLSDSEEQEERRRKRKEWNQTYYELSNEVQMSLNKLEILLQEEEKLIKDDKSLSEDKK